MSQKTIHTNILYKRKRKTDQFISNVGYYFCLECANCVCMEFETIKCSWFPKWSKNHRNRRKCLAFQPQKQQNQWENYLTFLNPAHHAHLIVSNSIHREFAHSRQK